MKQWKISWILKDELSVKKQKVLGCAFLTERRTSKKVKQSSLSSFKNLLVSRYVER